MDTLQRQWWLVKVSHLLILVLKQCRLESSAPVPAKKHLDFISNACLNSTDGDIIEEFVQKLFFADLLLAKEGKQAHCYAVWGPDSSALRFGGGKLDLMLDALALVFRVNWLLWIHFYRELLRCWSLGLMPIDSFSSLFWISFLLSLLLRYLLSVDLLWARLIACSLLVACFDCPILRVPSPHWRQLRLSSLQTFDVVAHIWDFFLFNQN